MCTTALGVNSFALTFRRGSLRLTYVADTWSMSFETTGTKQGPAAAVIDYDASRWTSDRADGRMSSC